MVVVIPEEFTLYGCNYTVVTDKKLFINEGNYAEISYRKKRITLTEWENETTNKDFATQCFYHELVHGIFEALGEHELRQNEKLVDNFAHLLYEFEKSKKGALNVITGD